ncbi:MAG TPA: DPP IV N-terminal domain-containing protein [Methanospirillum sp.]|uniref:S9 family peptidase n=1 Tax=Methanospirillum sp. TaxID=45200 RepID=UPI002B6F66BE|nr:DPP IV N-terminal domain-containing protein [Methanospirillum sp.]HWQ63983.1 DPP IV N-terminal domain-containing protein [Methanospirillum sp.]
MFSRSFWFHLLTLITIAILIFTPVQARDTNRPTPEEINMAELFYPDNAVSHIYHANLNPSWVRNDSFWYMDAGKQTTMFFLVNTSQNSRTRLLDTDRLVASLSNVSGKEIDPAHLPITNIALSPDLNSIRFDAFGASWSCDLSVYHLSDITLPAAVRAGLPSPDQHYIAYINESNLALYDTMTGVSSQLTTDGVPDYFYAKRSDTVRYTVTEARLNSSPIPYLVWSPDSTKIRTFKVDQRNVSQYYLVQNVPENGSVKPILYSYKFATPGDTSVPEYEPVTINISTRQVVPMHWTSQPETTMMDTDQDELSRWNSIGDEMYTLYLERGEKTLRLLKENPITGDVHEVLNETGETYREANLQYASKPNFAILEKSGDIIWFSERDGWGHLYRYDANGTLKNQITSGPWVVRDLLAVDENTSTVYFTASGKEIGNPYYKYLYRASLDGSGLTLLTPGNADHEITLSPDLSSFVESYSRTDLPTVADLKSIDRTLLMHLGAADDSDLKSKGWVSPERVTFKARDGVTDLYGLVFRPTDFDKTRKYPVVDIVYPGPYTIVTATQYPSDSGWNSKIFWTSQMLAELGYVVVTMDGLGTAYRSKAFHDMSYANLSDCGLADHIAGLKDLATRYSWMDISRVGMYGKSAGGFMTAQAMLTYPDFFKVGVAASGDQDCRLYGSFWGEKYEGFPVSDRYLEQVTSKKAANLTGKLLLLTGDMDDNVHPAMTMQLADALEKSNKTFDMFVFTNKNHDLNYDPYYLRKMMRYFVDNL